MVRIGCLKRLSYEERTEIQIAYLSLGRRFTLDARAARQSWFRSVGLKPHSEHEHHRLFASLLSQDSSLAGRASLTLPRGRSVVTAGTARDATRSDGTWLQVRARGLAPTKVGEFAMTDESQLSFKPEPAHLHAEAQVFLNGQICSHATPLRAHDTLQLGTTLFLVSK